MYYKTVILKIQQQQDKKKENRMSVFNYSTSKSEYSF